MLTTAFATRLMIGARVGGFWASTICGAGIAAYRRGGAASTASAIRAKAATRCIFLSTKQSGNDDEENEDPKTGHRDSGDGQLGAGPGARHIACVLIRFERNSAHGLVLQYIENIGPEIGRAALIQINAIRVLENSDLIR